MKIRQIASIFLAFTMLYFSSSTLIFATTIEDFKRALDDCMEKRAKYRKNLPRLRELYQKAIKANKELSLYESRMDKAEKIWQKLSDAHLEALNEYNKLRKSGKDKEAESFFKTVVKPRENKMKKAADNYSKIEKETEKIREVYQDAFHRYLKENREKGGWLEDDPDKNLDYINKVCNDSADFLKVKTLIDKCELEEAAKLLKKLPDYPVKTNLNSLLSEVKKREKRVLFIYNEAKTTYEKGKNQERAGELELARMAYKEAIEKLTKASTTTKCKDRKKFFSDCIQKARNRLLQVDKKIAEGGREEGEHPPPVSKRGDPSERLRASGMGYVEGVLGMEWNTNRIGKDYKNFDLSEPNPELCRDACAKDPRCKACTYVKPGYQKPTSGKGPKARCWLKPDVPPATSGECCHSWVK